VFLSGLPNATTRFTWRFPPPFSFDQDSSK
jgi:hypothetical protein